MHSRLALVVVVICALAGIVHAEDRATAERYFRLGEKAYQSQNFAAAADNFEEAYKNFNLAEIAFSAAQAYRRLYRLEPKPEHVQRAVDLYKVYLGKVKSGGRVADAADALAEMQHELDKLISSGVQVSPALAKQYTRLVINPSLGTDVSSTNMEEVKEGDSKATLFTATLDGQPADVFAPINVLPKVYKIVVTVDGYFPGTREASAPQGATTIVDVPLVPRPARVTIESVRGARVAVDGRPVGTVPIAPQELPAGRHVISISMRGREPIAREVVVTRGQELDLRAPLQMTTRRRLVPWLLGGAAVAAAFAGMTTTFAFIRDNDAEDRLSVLRLDGGFTQADLDGYDRARRARDRWRTAAYVSGASLAAIIGAAAILYYTDNPSPDGVRVEPLTVQGGAGATIAGGF